MLLDQTAWRALLIAACDAWEAGVPRLNSIDSAFGDGDHGITIGKIARLVRSAAEQWQDEPIKAFLAGLGDAVMAVGGGSAGPLYGMIFAGLAAPLPEQAEAVDAATLKAMLAGVEDELRTITTAQIGDKTMMDALLPAVAAAQTAPDGIGQILSEANRAAAAGAKATEQMVAKYGRARLYGEQSLGTPDAGALSTALLFEGLDNGLAAL
ncbi:MAG: DAK2 domain-containing protein [Bifidobacteriaceae bacterium]|jgi:dihydroxyacetone kinase-like protein|nr:DAK2 domain-containing protein [Bifidobacteriaceae bacterium]